MSFQFSLTDKFPVLLEQPLRLLGMRRKHIIPFREIIGQVVELEL